MDSIRLQKLKESPMFQLSLGSKELFHSNFLYWLWKAEPDAFWKIMEQFDIRISDKDSLEVKREWKHFDLSIVHVHKKKDTVVFDDVLAVIENKVKSVPRKDQLEEYSKTIAAIDKKGCKKILLSLIESDWGKTEGWDNYSYEKYKDIIKQILDSSIVGDTYNRSIITDYYNMIEALATFKKEWTHERFASMRYLDIFDNPSINDYKELRINDLRQKMIFSKMFSILEQELGKKLGKENLKKGKTVEQILSETKTEEIKLAIGFGMTNATGFIDIKVNIENKYILGIQLQGDQYRHYIEYGKEPTQEPNLNKFKDLFNHGDIYSTKSNKICSFKNKNKEKTFYYVYQNKDDSVCRKTIGDVINQIVADVEYLMKKY